MRAAISLLLLLAACASAPAASGRIIKVLPHLLDLKGRHALSPSLYDRDAYQAYLREHPENQSGIRFDIEWSAKAGPEESLKLLVEVRGMSRGDLPELFKLEKVVEPGRWNHWSALTLQGKDFQTLGKVTAWRATLWAGPELLSEQKSFLW